MRSWSPTVSASMRASLRYVVDQSSAPVVTNSEFAIFRVLPTDSRSV
jgi:hypothetical protein